VPTLGYTVGCGTVVVRSLLIEWHHFRSIVG
jgi:hypothetical protein